MKNTCHFSLVILLVNLLLVVPIMGQQHEVISPDGDLVVQLELGSDMQIKVEFKGSEVISSLGPAMLMDGETLRGSASELIKASTAEQESIVVPVVPNKDSKIQARYQELLLDFKGGFQFQVRAYNKGWAYRFVVDQKKFRTVDLEHMDLRFPSGTSALFPKEESIYSHNERLYLPMKEEDFQKGDFCSLPVLFDTGLAKVLFTEADLIDYPGMFLVNRSGLHFDAMHPAFVLKSVPDENNSPDRNEVFVEKADYIAEVSGPRPYPWRVFMVSDDDRTFVESSLVTLLSGESQIDDPSWIKPGQVAWDWYNANNIYGVDFEAGINTSTYEYFIDFAAENGIPYVILDEGWTRSTTDILGWNDDIDVQHLIDYARERAVGIILWVLWKPLQEDVEGILALYSGWGAKGIKVDFMQRNDQSMVRSYEEIARVAAKHKLLVDYHGAFKPAGLERLWPNIVNYEGVKGNENNKWSADITPEHNVTIPFIRMAAGPMDFTPGAMINKNSRNYSASFFRPMSLGTRCHQMAMYVVYEAPLQMLCESPSTYRKEQECLDFMVDVPTTWDETRVIHAQVADYIFLARRKGEAWYLGGMTDDSPRTLEVSLDFLGGGQYTIEYFQDGVNAVSYAQDYKKVVAEVDGDTKIFVDMAPGGGWVGVIREK